MKKVLSLFFVSLLVAAFATGQVKERLNVPGPLLFDNTKYFFAWSDKPNETYYVQEYLPAGDSLQKFKQLLTIHLFTNDISLKDAVQLKAAELEVRKKKDPVCHYMVTQSPGGNEFIIDCVVGENSGKQTLSAEFIVYRYKKITLENNRSGILIYAYSNRVYGDDVKHFLKQLRKERINYLNKMIETDMPEIKLNERS